MGGNLPPGYPSFGSATETSARAHRAAVVWSSRGPLLVPPASAEAEDGREAEGWGFGIPGFCSRFGSTFWAKLSYSIFLDSLTQVVQFQTSESQLERTFNLARFR